MVERIINYKNQIRAYVRSGTSDAFVVREVFSGEYRRLQIKPSDIVLDIGLNIGMFMALALKNGAKKVIGFEPDADNFRLASKNLQLNKFSPSQYLAINKAVVGTENRRREFSINLKKNKGAHSLIHKRGRATVEVDAININHVIEKYRPTIIKMDIEGGEAECIPAIKSDNWKGIREIIIEFHHAHLLDMKKREKYLQILQIMKKHFSNVDYRENPKGAWVSIIYAQKQDVGAYDPLDTIVTEAKLAIKEKIERPKPAKDRRQSLIVRFRTQKDANKFAGLIKAEINHDNPKTPIIYNPNSRVSPARAKFIKSSRKSAEKNPSKTDLDLSAEANWTGTVPFENEKQGDFAECRIQFKSVADVSHFIRNVLKARLTPETNSIYYPVRERDDLISKVWLCKNRNLTKPKYPIYVVSKGRWAERTTVRTLDAMNIDYRVVIESQQQFEYATYIDEKKLLVLPFAGDHGFGPGPARNFCWDHAKKAGHKKHWVLDDNIDGFYRLHENMRIRVGDGSIFRAAEEFIDRYDNIFVSGFQYRFFAAPRQKQRPYALNTRIYSCLLIDHRCPHRWRGRYNEDTILSLDLLKDGYPTLQFNAFLQGKLATQTQSGGNTEEFYSKDEGTTLPKSQMLIAVHPDVSRLVMKYGRPHHEVDYSGFKDNPLKRKRGYLVPKADPFKWQLVEREHK